jgi:hypothetical protein
VGDLHYAQCHVEPSLTTDMGCTAVWGTSKTQECDCCPGNYCQQMNWGVQCMPNGVNSDCRKNEEFTTFSFSSDHS